MMPKVLYLSVIDKHLSAPLLKNSHEQLAYARALVSVIYIMTIIMFIGPLLLLTPDYQPSTLEVTTALLLTTLTISSIIVLKFSSAVKSVAIFICLINYVASAIILVIDHSSISIQVLWLLIFPVIGFVFVSRSFGITCSLVSLSGFIFCQQYPPVIPEAYGTLAIFSHNLGINLSFIIILLALIILSSLNVIQFLNKISKEKSIKLEESNKLLQRLSYIDNLTGLYNRNYFDEQFQTLWQQNFKDQTHLSLLLMDIDSFKPYNDNYGHSAGDECLVEVASAINDSLRQLGDAAYRWGGEEFLVVLSNADETVTKDISERITQNLADKQIIHEYTLANSPFVTFSIGGLTILPAQKEMDLKDMLQEVDRQLYKAKHNGRNQTCFSPIKVYDGNIEAKLT